MDYTDDELKRLYGRSDDLTAPGRGSTYREDPHPDTGRPMRYGVRGERQDGWVDDPGMFLSWKSVLRTGVSVLLVMLGVWLLVSLWATSHGMDAPPILKDLKGR